MACALLRVSLCRRYQLTTVGLPSRTGTITTLASDVEELNVAAVACDKLGRRGPVNLWCVDAHFENSLWAASVH